MPHKDGERVVFGLGCFETLSCFVYVWAGGQRDDVQLLAVENDWLAAHIIYWGVTIWVDRVAYLQVGDRIRNMPGLAVPLGIKNIVGTDDQMLIFGGDTFVPVGKRQNILDKFMPKPF